MKRLFIIILTFALGAALSAKAQSLEEVIVTGMKYGGEKPGTALKKTGDFLLLAVLVTNDSREASQRQKEVYKTLKNALSKAKMTKNIQLSLLQDGYVIPMTEQNYRVGLKQGNRPDTSKTTIRVKAPIVGNEDPANLIGELRAFVDKVAVVGRTEMRSLRSVDVSLVDPNQYRGEILELFAEDVKLITESLGGGYRVIVEGIDRPITWERVGALQLALFIPYRYSVIPESVTSVSIVPEY